uniref:Kinesin motor domain-containing protein n=1 Tax=Poecilia formosa TaxID=48698 RepID=A0A096MHV9_POEFO
MSSVRVAVRVRPLNKREKRLSSKVIIHMRGNTTSIHKVRFQPSAVRGEKLKDRGKMFSYDYCFDSVDADSPTFSSQEKIFKDLGSDVLKAAFDGYNACVFAYGQTGSGKSYTMMGNKVDKGLIPRICEGLFLEISNRSGSNGMSFHMEVSSYLEIYNERVQDLLKKRLPYSEGGALKVREHPTDGPYVENLSKHVVLSQSNVESLITLGNATRTIASTGMNDFSSRSHTIFTIIFTQGWFDGELPHERHSKIQLVDLAGSERADGTQAVGTRLKESANINKSLITLNSVISALADLAVSGQSAKKKQIFIPYRNSVLTWLLKDSLGGNTRTTIIATISPADVNYEETLTTLRFARRAKNIINTPTVNEDGSTKVVRELKAEVTRLRSLLAEAAQVFDVHWATSVKQKEKLQYNQEKVKTLAKQWITKWRGAQSILEVTAMGVCKCKSGFWLDHSKTLFVEIERQNLPEGVLLYYLKEGKTWIQNEASCCQETVLSGPELPREHCLLENCAGIVTLFPQDGALCSVNGSAVTHPCQLTQGAIIQLGGGPILRFNHPAKASQLKEKQQKGKIISNSETGFYSSCFSLFYLQSGLLSSSSQALTDLSKSAENLSEVKLQNSGKIVNQQLTYQNAFEIFLSSPLINYLARAETNPLSGEDFGWSEQSDLSLRWEGEISMHFCLYRSFPVVVLARLKLLGVPDVIKTSGIWSKISNTLRMFTIGVLNSRQSFKWFSKLGFKGNCLVKAQCSSMSHLQSSGGSGSFSVLPQTSAYSQFNRKPFSKQDQHSCGEMEETGILEEIKRVAENPVRKLGLGSLFSKVSCIVRNAHSLLWRSPALLHQLTTVNKSPIFSVVKALPLIRHIQMNTSHPLQPKETALMIQDFNNSNNTQLSTLTPRQSVTKQLVGDVLEVSRDFCKRDLQSPEKQDGNNFQIKQDEAETVHVCIQTLIKFPNPLLKLQTLPLGDLMGVVQSVSCSVPSSQRIVALHWLNIAKCSQPDPQPGLLIVTKTDLYTLTANSGALVLFHHLPLLQLRDVLIGFAGQSLRLIGNTEERLLGVYTHNQKQTKELCWAILNAVCSGDSRLHQCQLLHDNLMELSLDCKVYVPDMQLDSGLRLYCRFQNSLIDLLYLIHCNIDQATVALGELQLLMYTSVAVQLSCHIHSEQMAQFFLTDNHFGLAREDVVFPKAIFSEFDVLALCHCSDVRCVLMHDEDSSGSVMVDVIIAKARAKGHPESMTKPDTSPHTEVWKLTFSCSTEATCLINHLSNV